MVRSERANAGPKGRCEGMRVLECERVRAAPYLSHPHTLALSHPHTPSLLQRMVLRPDSRLRSAELEVRRLVVADQRHVRFFRDLVLQANCPVASVDEQTARPLGHQVVRRADRGRKYA